MILTDAEIEAHMQAHINDHWPPTQREKALRLGGQLLTDLNAFFDTCTVLKAEKVAERDLAVAVRDYDAAVSRLSYPTLVISDSVTQEQIETDAAERATAQVVVDAASSEVLAVVIARNA